MAAAAVPAGLKAIGVRAVEIIWHGSEVGASFEQHGVMSCDFHPREDRLATGGGDDTVRVWNFDRAQGTSAVSARLAHEVASTEVAKIFTLAAAIEVGSVCLSVKWSPRGTLLATAHANDEIHLFHKDETGGSASAAAAAAAAEGLEYWSRYRKLRGHASDVTDVAFSPDARYLISSDGEGVVMVHDILQGSVHHTVKGAHDPSCHGVSWDPLNLIATSFGNDQRLKWYQVQPAKPGKRSSLALNEKRTNDKLDGGTMFKREHGAHSSRRTSWSPDGALCAVPYGWLGKEDKGFHECFFVFGRNDLTKPLFAQAIGPEKSGTTVLGVSFAPCLFAPAVVADEAGGAGGSPDRSVAAASGGAWGPAEYRYAVAAWTYDCVFVYTSDADARFAALTDLHMDRITDVAWTPDARFLAVSSLDFYVSLAAFNRGIGEVVPLATVSTPLAKAVYQLQLPLAEACEANEAAFRQAASGNAANDGPPKAAGVVVVKKKKRDRPATEEAPPVMEAPVARDATEEEMLAGLADFDFDDAALADAVGDDDDDDAPKKHGDAPAEAAATEAA